jgi:hypothetical protein
LPRSGSRSTSCCSSASPSAFLQASGPNARLSGSLRLRTVENIYNFRVIGQFSNNNLLNKMVYSHGTKAACFARMGTNRHSRKEIR